MIIRICDSCGKEFDVKYPSSKQKYCSVKCGCKNHGGYREGSGKSKSGYYRGIYCGSTYELAWVIYRLDHNLSVTRFDGFIVYSENKKYFPDFIDGNIVIEIKGWTTSKTDPILQEKANATISRGFDIVVLFKDDLKDEFLWCKEHYKYTRLEELYDDYRPKYEIKCRTCGILFDTDNKKRTCCSRKCGVTIKGSKMSTEQKLAISRTLKLKHKTTIG